MRGALRLFPHTPLSRVFLIHFLFYVCFYINRRVFVKAVWLRKCLDLTVSVLRHLAAAVAAQLNSSLSINRAALYESRITYHIVEAHSRPRHNLKTFLQLLIISCVLTHTVFSFRRPRIELKVPSWLCLLKLIQFDSCQWAMISLLHLFIEVQHPYCRKSMLSCPFFF